LELFKKIFKGILRLLIFDLDYFLELFYKKNVLTFCSRFIPLCSIDNGNFPDNHVVEEESNVTETRTTNRLYILETRVTTLFKAQGQTLSLVIYLSVLIILFFLYFFLLLHVGYCGEFVTIRRVTSVW
jgi:hypothetical protein